jgi:hypothetical protein
LIWRIVTSDRMRGESYDAVAAWPITRTIAANELLDAFSDFDERSHAYARAEAERARANPRAPW